MPIAKSLVLDFSLFVSEARNRRALLSDRAATLAGDNFSFNEVTLAINQSTTIDNIGAMLLVKSSGPFTININSLGTVDVNDLFISTGSISSAVINNPGTDAIDCQICNS